MDYFISHGSVSPASVWVYRPVDGFQSQSLFVFMLALTERTILYRTKMYLPFCSCFVICWSSCVIWDGVGCIVWVWFVVCTSVWLQSVFSHLMFYIIYVPICNSFYAWTEKTCIMCYNLRQMEKEVCLHVCKCVCVCVYVHVCVFKGAEC